MCRLEQQWLWLDNNGDGTMRIHAVVPTLAGAILKKILDQMFTFDNLNDLDDRGVQLLLREVQSESLVIALGIVVIDRCGKGREQVEPAMDVADRIGAAT